MEARGMRKAEDGDGGGNGGQEDVWRWEWWAMGRREGREDDCRRMETRKVARRFTEIEICSREPLAPSECVHGHYSSRTLEKVLNTNSGHMDAAASYPKQTRTSMLILPILPTRPSNACSLDSHPLTFFVFCVSPLKQDLLLP